VKGALQRLKNTCMLQISQARFFPFKAGMWATKVQEDQNT